MTSNDRPAGKPAGSTEQFKSRGIFDDSLGRLKSRDMVQPPVRVTKPKPQCESKTRTDGIELD